MSEIEPGGIPERKKYAISLEPGKTTLLGLTPWIDSRIPLTILTPEQRRGTQPPHRTHRPVSQLDLYPTLVELAGLPPNPTNRGRSLAPLLLNPDAEGYAAVIITHGYGNHAVRSERWRYIRYEDGAEELYDHWNDPQEWTNLAAAPHLKPVIAALRGHLPKDNARWDPRVTQGSHYNEYMRDLFERSRADR